MSRSTSLPPEQPPAEPVPVAKPTPYFQADERLIGRSIVGAGAPPYPVLWWLTKRGRRQHAMFRRATACRR